MNWLEQLRGGWKVEQRGIELWLNTQPDQAKLTLVIAGKAVTFSYPTEEAALLVAEQTVRLAGGVS